ncbi:DUF1145 domain-containing protein [Shewanella yunxiaonensis]|uniref:DUF1145 domain-containing protein n=1 Tax=Shewanella yunxiaonensis TaxID=2829809 RepID=A0ABX7YTW9_9GAMM|nr:MULTISPECIES: DUF1145 domain-containing protein [Shewanella]MDF0533397.1 DUF1145 domain-containing protein [Shewanella sp. A32]QUN05779.1 DUF1145 domain-containing protein [Shewanella yunxiaonensis]
MRATILFGKSITALAWLLMVFNLLHPFAGNIAIILNILLGVTTMMHGLQTLIFYTLFNQALPLAKADYVKAFIFGVFALLEYRQKLLQQQAQSPHQR